MGLINILTKGSNSKKGDQQKILLEKMDVARKYFNRILKGEKETNFKFVTLDQESKSFLYKSPYKNGIIELQLSISMNSKDIRLLVDDIIREIGYLESKYREHYEDVQLNTYKYDLSGEREVSFNINGVEKSLSYNEDMNEMAETIRSLISEEQTSLKGIISGRETNFLIDDQYDLVSFLLKNKGRKVKIELVE